MNKSYPLLFSSLVVFVFFGGMRISFAQSKASNIDLLEQQNFYEPRYEKRNHISFMWISKKNVWVRYNPVSLTLGGLLYLYQQFLSPQILANCPYTPSCSNFSRRAIEGCGLGRGILLSADRLMRCNRLAVADISILDIEKEKIQDPPHKYYNCTR